MRVIEKFENNKTVIKLLDKFSIAMLFVTGIFLFFVLINYSFSQESAYTYQKINEELNIENIEFDNSEWSNYLSNEKIDVLYKKVECKDKINGIDKDMILLKFLNKTDKDINISWELELKYNGKCLNCKSENKELHFKNIIRANGEISGNCDDRQNGLTIFYKHSDNNLSKTTLENFTVKNFKY